MLKIKNYTQHERDNFLYEMRGSLMLALRQASLLEERLKQTFQFVEPTEKNYATYSLASREIIIQACIQIETIARKYYRSFLKITKKFSWQDFAEQLSNVDTVRFFDGTETSTDLLYLKNSHVLFTPFKTIQLFEYDSIHLFPWENVENKTMPSWWNDGYNKIKHGENFDLSFCTYLKAIEALAGLYVFISFISFNTECHLNKDTEFYPQLFTCSYFNECFYLTNTQDTIRG